MPLVIIDESNENDIPLRDMRDGQIGIITKWTEDYEGQIAQRYADSLFILGSGVSEAGWTNIFKNSLIMNDVQGYRVRILPPGTKFKLTAI